MSQREMREALPQLLAEVDALTAQLAALREALKEEIAARNASIMGEAWYRMPREERDTLVALRLASYNTREIRGRELATESISVDRTQRLDAAFLDARTEEG